MYYMYFVVVLVYCMGHAERREDANKIFFNAIIISWMHSSKLQIFFVGKFLSPLLCFCIKFLYCACRVLCRCIIVKICIVYGFCLFFPRGSSSRRFLVLPLVEISNDQIESNQKDFEKVKMISFIMSDGE